MDRDLDPRAAGPGGSPVVGGGRQVFGVRQPPVRALPVTRVLLLLFDAQVEHFARRRLQPLRQVPKGTPRFFRVIVIDLTDLWGCIIHRGS